MDSQIKVIVLAAQRWDFQGDDGEQHKGVSVYVCHIGGHHAYAGQRPVKYTMSSESYALFAQEQLPAVALMTVSYDFDRQKMLPVSFENFEPLAV